MQFISATAPDRLTFHVWHLVLVLASGTQSAVSCEDYSAFIVWILPLNAAGMTDKIVTYLSFKVAL